MVVPVCTVNMDVQTTIIWITLILLSLCFSPLWLSTIKRSVGLYSAGPDTTDTSWNLRISLCINTPASIRQPILVVAICDSKFFNVVMLVFLTPQLNFSPLAITSSNPGLFLVSWTPDRLIIIGLWSVVCVWINIYNLFCVKTSFGIQTS